MNRDGEVRAGLPEGVTAELRLTERKTPARGEQREARTRTV